MKDIYMIYSPEGHAPKETYDYFNEAMTEAKKRADTFPGETFHVMEAINELKVPAEVIEVGDTVHVKSGMWIRNVKVVWQREGSDNLMVQCYTDIHHKVLLSDCTLISKAPKVHTFEGVEIYQREGNVLVVPQKANALDDFCNGTRQTYTMTLKEEVSQ